MILSKPSQKLLLLAQLAHEQKHLNYYKNSDTKFVPVEFWNENLKKYDVLSAYIKTNDKKTFEYGFRQAKGNPYLFKDCNRIK